MNCNKCGVMNLNNEKFCKNCGCILNNDEINNIETSGLMKEEKELYQNTKKYAIISILVGIGGIIFAFVVGMSLWLSIVLSCFGFEMARRSKDENNLLSIIGYVLNSILLVIGVLVYISIILGII